MTVNITTTAPQAPRMAGASPGEFRGRRRLDGLDFG